MSASQSTKEQQQTIKATLKAIEQDYKSKVREAEKKCNALRKEADKVADRERAETKAKKDKADKEAKEEYQLVKHEAGDIHVQLVMDLVKNVILDIKSRNLEQLYAKGGFIGRSNSTCSAASTSSSSSSSLAKEDAEIKEWVEYAAERMEIHMSKSQARQRLLEEIASGALIRQHQAEQEAMRRTEDLQRQLQQLQLQQQQQQQQQGGMTFPQGQDAPPPAYMNTMGTTGINAQDYSVYDKKN
ncbi:hypothetical protein EDD21DRAFT_379105 [Dissophora ornata]|nr:hypothetical protein BGZ58_000908 [Dissophora ornata]KAI8599716.1 hypothetical protein EDD21DRAFT_379105 [Dissophora ornata]